MTLPPAVPSPAEPGADDDQPVYGVDRPPPFPEHAGIRLVAVGNGVCELELTVGPEHLNANGTMHGGVPATMIDTACGFAGSRPGGPGDPIRPLMTLSLLTQYLAPRNVGDVIRCVAAIRGGGGTQVFATAEVTGSDGTLVATGKASMRYRSPRPGAEVRNQD